MKNTLQYIIQKLGVSNKEALRLIMENKVLVNGIPANIKQEISENDEVTIENKIIKIKQEYIYLAYYKPRGIECTLNPAIPFNLKSQLNLDERVFPIGRLDKESEGLLLLTNDGNIYNQLAHSEQHVEKEYLVEVNLPLTESAIEHLRNGIEIMGKMTRPAIVEILNNYSFNIILTQGLNRQIRRMCYKLGYEVLSLKRIRIANISIGNLKEGEIRKLESFF